MRPTTSLSRRRFLVGAGASLIASSLLGVFRGESRADGSSAAKRLVVVFSPNGTIHSHWRPQGSGASFTFPAGSILEPLQKHKSKLLICDGVDYKSRVNEETRVRNLLRMVRDLEHHGRLTLRDRLSFLKSYARAAGAGSANGLFRRLADAVRDKGKK